MGRTLDNAVCLFLLLRTSFQEPCIDPHPKLLNLNLKDQYKEGVEKLGFNMEDLLEKERDAALGNGGLGRLAACYLDSSASQVSLFFSPLHDVVILAFWMLSWSDEIMLTFFGRNCPFGVMA